ncbi:MAG: hypothetical protein SPL75_04900 [Bacilli bacterium]|nr:hypothetical protein [Bacilli bacterium]
MKPRMKKALKRAAIISTGVLAFVGTFIGGYIVTPNRTKFIDVSVDTPEPTAFGQFVTKITKDIGLDEEENTAAKYLNAQFDNFKVSYKMNKDASFTNYISVEGDIDFRMSALSLSGVEFNVNAVADYNGKKLPLTLGRFQDDVYFRLKDLKLKMTDFKGDKIVDEYWYAFAVYANMDLPKLMRDLGEFANEKVGGLIDALINGSSEESTENANAEPSTGGFDFMSLLANEPKEEQVGSDWLFTLGEEGGDFCIKITTDDKFTLKYVDLGKITFGDTTIQGGIRVNLKDYESFVSPASGNDYVEVFNYTGITNKLFSILREDGKHQRFGFKFALDLDGKDKKKNDIDIAKIKGSVNVDFDKLLDLSQYIIDSEPQEDPQVLNLDDALNDVGFNLQVDLIGQNDMKYANFDLGYAEGNGYVRFNEQEDTNHNKKAVMKLKMDTETTNRIVHMVPSMIDSTSGDQSNNSIDTLKNFLTDDLIKSVDKGDFSFVLDILDALESNADGIHVGLNLSKLGIGKNARVDVNLKNDSKITDINDVFGTSPTLEDVETILNDNDNQSLSNISKFSIDASNISFGDYTANVSVNTAAFSELSLGNKAEYQSVKFIPDVIDQVSNFIQTKKTGFSVTGSMKDKNGLGTVFSGEGQLDNNDEIKRGYGTMHIDEYKYHSNTIWATHDMAVDIANVASNIVPAYEQNGVTYKRQNNNQALFVYGKPNAANIKGKLRLQTFSDILDIVKTFVNDYGNESKFTKFLGPIMELMGFGAIGDIINSKDYVKLASNELLKEVSVIDNGAKLRIVISQVMLRLPSDITIEVAFNGNNDSGNQSLKSLDVVNFAMGSGDDAKLLNFHFQLEDYDENYQSVINRANVANEKYMNLDGIKVLLDLGINTTKPNYWHLSASANVNALGKVLNIDLTDIDFYIYVDGEKAKVYGKFGSVPVSGVYTEDVLISGDKIMSSEMTFETFNDENHNGVSGMFNIQRTLKNPTSRLTWDGGLKRYYYYDNKTYHYRSESKNFLDEIATYLLGGVIGIKSSYLESKLLGNMTSSSSEKEAGNFVNTFTSTGFNCGREIYEGVDSSVIRLGLNLNELTGIDALREVEATIVSKEIPVGYDEEGKPLKDENENVITMDILGTLIASLRVHFIADINVSFTASVKDAELDEKKAESKWNDNGQSRLTALSGNINGKAISETQNSSYFNNAKNPYTYSWEQPR